MLPFFVAFLVKTVLFYTFFDEKHTFFVRFQVKKRLK